MSAREVPFEKWSFVDRNDLDTEHWYVRLEGGEYHEVIYQIYGCQTKRNNAVY